jgi:hypothetical protein
MTVEFLALQLHFLLALRVLRGKHQNMLALVVNLAHLATTILFPYAIGDNALKRYKGLLESLAQKQNHLNDRTTRHRHILYVVPQG